MCKQYQLIFITFCRTKHLTFRVLKQKKIHYFQRSDGNEPHHPDYERRSGRQYAKLLEITICQKKIVEDRWRKYTFLKLHMQSISISLHTLDVLNVPIARSRQKLSERCERISRRG